MENYQIIITRNRASYGSALKYTVEIDGFSSGVLKNGSSIVISTTSGHHVLSFLFHGKVEKSVPVFIGPENYTTRLSVRINGWKKLEIERDNSAGCAPESSRGDIPTPKKKKGPLKIIGKVLIALIILIIIGSVFGSDESESPSQKQTESPQAEELTPEEKAAIQLEDATAEFADGDYMSAIEVCNKVIAEYPDTDVSKNMGSYLETQYAQFPHISAEDLMNEYDANIVNADEEYTDTIMIVSGTVTSIGKTNNDKNLAVMLDSGTYFYGVQLNFKTSQTDSVAQLAEGDAVTAIGKCTGKSGTQFIILDSNNVMIEDCYLISQ